jgi:pentose-5-phosphate-3-epimerase
MKVLPAILQPTIEEFHTQLNQLAPYFNHFSIDIQDGKFVPSKTISTSDILEYFKDHTELSGSIFDFDLMTYQYEQALKDIMALSKIIRVGNVVVQKTLVSPQVILENNHLSIGLSLNSSDMVEGLATYGNLNKIPLIQIMTVAAGPQGQSFIAKMLNKIEQLRTLDYRNVIYIDGAVNDESLPLILEQKYKPDFACVGSFLSKAGQKLGERVKYLRAIEEKT